MDHDARTPPVAGPAPGERFEHIHALIRELELLHACALGAHVCGVPLGGLLRRLCGPSCARVSGPALLIAPSLATRIALASDILIGAWKREPLSLATPVALDWRVLRSDALLLQLSIERRGVVLPAAAITRAEHFLDSWNGTPILRRAERERTRYAMRVMLSTRALRDSTHDRRSRQRRLQSASGHEPSGA